MAAPLRAEVTRATSGWRADKSQRDRAFIALGIIGAVGLLLASELPVCPTALFFGIPCPGCGLTRATRALLHGHVHEALALHPLVFVLAPLFFGAMAKVLFDFVRGPAPDVPPGASFWTTRAVTVVASLLLVAVVGVWLARFAGYFGGPVPVESITSLIEQN